MQNFEKFTQFVKTECKKNRVLFKEYKRRYIKLSDSIKCGGFFSSGEGDTKGPTLAYAMGNPDAASLLVHEYAHMTQWLEGLPLWKEAEVSLDYLDRWLEGTEVDAISHHIDVAKELELDNEKRSVELIRRWELPLDIPEYIKKANSYLQFYLYLKESRRWSQPGRAPYHVPEIVELMSDEFNMDYGALTPEIRQAFIEKRIGF